jgi:hypothetical protein
VSPPSERDKAEGKRNYREGKEEEKFRNKYFDGSDAFSANL